MPGQPQAIEKEELALVLRADTQEVDNRLLFELSSMSPAQLKNLTRQADYPHIKNCQGDLELILDQPQVTQHREVRQGDSPLPVVSIREIDESPDDRTRWLLRNRLGSFASREKPSVFFGVIRHDPLKQTPGAAGQSVNDRAREIG